MNLAKLLMTLLLAVCVVSCNDSDSNSSPRVESEISSLVDFSAGDGGNPETEINLVVTFPASTTGYESVSIYRQQGTTPPDCGSGTLVTSITNFSVNPLSYIDAGLTGEEDYAYRACVYASGNVLNSSSTAGHTTAAGACLVGDTKVSIPGGEKDLAALKVGDLVLSYDEVLDRVVVSRVLAFKAYGEKAVGTYKINDRFITAVPRHSFFDSNSRSYLPIQSFVSQSTSEFFNPLRSLFLDKERENLFEIQDTSVVHMNESYDAVFDIRV